MIEDSNDEVVLSLQSSAVKTSEGGNNHFQSAKLLSTEAKVVNSTGDGKSESSPPDVKAFRELDQDDKDSLASLSDYNIQIEMKQVLEMVEPVGNDLVGAAEPEPRRESAPNKLTD